MLLVRCSGHVLLLMLIFVVLVVSDNLYSCEDVLSNVDQE